MAQIQKKFIANNAVDGTKIQLLNAQAFNALNASASPTEIFNFNASNNLEFDVQIDANSNAIINLATPTNPGDAVNKSYADSLVSNLSWKTVVDSATTTTLPTYTYLSGVITEVGFGALPAQDGVTLTVGQRLLVKNETGGNQPYNGIYIVTDTGGVGTSFVLTRSTDANTAVELTSAAVSVGEAATTQFGQVYFESSAITTIGADNVTFIQINSGMSYTFGNGLNLSGSTVTVKPDVAGAITVSGSGVAVAVDNSTIAISSDQLIVKSAGITTTQLANASVTEAIIASSALSSTGALTGGSGTKLAVAVDGSTVEIVTDALHALATKVDNLTLNGTDITNQYKDLSFAITGTGSVFLSVIGGIIQKNGTDYTVSATGGSGGVGRITFAGDLATGGNAALISGDVLVVSYDHF